MTTACQRSQCTQSTEPTQLTAQDQRAGGLLLLRAEVQPSGLCARALQGDRRGPCHEGDDQEKEGGGAEEDNGGDEANDGEH